MNLRDLNYIIAVADLSSFVKAAEHCHVSQPTLSTQIKKMEERLGVQLFERSNKKVMLTEIGGQIIDTARLIIKQTDHINELAAMSQNPLAGNFTLGAFPTLAPYLLPQLIPSIRQQLPDIRLILIEEKTDTLVEQIKQGRIDAALLALPIHEESLQFKQLFVDDFLLAVAADNTLATKQTIDQTDILHQRIMLLDEGHCLRDQALQVCQLSRAQEQQNFRATSLETLKQMVRAGTGITFIPKIATYQAEPDIRYIPFNKPAPNRKIALVWRKTSARTQLIDIIIELIKNSVIQVDND